MNYSREALAETLKREEIASQLADKRWRMRVNVLKGAFGFLTHPQFPDGVFFHKSSLANPGALREGDLVEVTVTLRRDERRNAWGYMAINMRTLENNQEGIGETKGEEIENRSNLSPPSEIPFPKNGVSEQDQSIKPKQMIIESPDNQTLLIPRATNAAPSWSFAWGVVLPTLILYAKGTTSRRTMDKVLEKAHKAGAPVEALKGWEPGAQELLELQQAARVVGRLCGGKRDVTSLMNSFNKVFRNSSSQWQALRKLAEAYLQERGIRNETYPIGRLTKKSLGKKNKVTLKENKVKSAGTMPKIGAAKGLSGISQNVIQGLKQQTLAVPTATTFAGDASMISIYIDESWPGTVDARKEQGMGIIAGIVWQGDRVDKGVLPAIQTHATVSQKINALRKMLGCNKVMPFIMPIRSPYEIAQRYYFELVETCIKVLLGWLLPQHGTKCSVRILIEHFNEEYWDGKDKTEYFQGVFREAQRFNPVRFGRWKLQSVRWYDKNMEYIPYGDSIAYLALEHTESNRQLGDLANFKTWPGYLPISLELMPRLMRLDQLESIGNVDDILDFIMETYGTELCRVVLNDLKLRLEGRKDLQHKLLEALENRYQHKVRDLSVLRRLFDAVSKLVPEPEEPVSARIRLLRAVLALQRANHDGDPERGKEAASRYREMRDEVLVHDRELVAYVDLNLAVHLNDQFMFEEAWIVNDELVDNPGFSYLSPLMQGKALSSLGQSLSITGQYEEAENKFVEALERLGKAVLNEPALGGELDKTRVYRAINALDGRLEGSIQYVKNVLGDFEKAIENLAEDVSIEKQYHQHLLLRSLWMMKDVGPFVNKYLEYKELWKTGENHPWQLIALYRALLLWRASPRDFEHESRMWFKVALAICENEYHGSTVQLIGAMIATIAYSCLDDQVFGNTAKRLLDAVEPKLPYASLSIHKLRDILQEPDPSRIDEALGTLPFNYH